MPPADGMARDIRELQERVQALEGDYAKAVRDYARAVRKLERITSLAEREKRQKEQANALLVGAVSLGAERTRERDAMRESCALICLDLITDTEREHMAYTVPGFDLGSGLAKITCAEMIRKGKP
jgi:hypothetical protein